MASAKGFDVHVNEPNKLALWRQDWQIPSSHSVVGTPNRVARIRYPSLRPGALMSRAPKKAWNRCWAEFISNEIGRFDFAATLTMKPIYGSRRGSTKRADAEQAFSWFLHVLNTRTFGHAHRRNGLELGVFAALEGLGHYEQPHWHVAFRLPSFLSRARFLSAFEKAVQRTRRFGYEIDFQSYYEGGWLEYSLKTGPDSFQPDFFRAGTR